MGPRIPDERKKKAVQEVETGQKTARQVYNEYDIQASQFHGWKARFGAPSPGHGDERGEKVDQGDSSVLQSRIDELLEDLERIEAENEELKKMYMNLLLEHKRTLAGIEKKN